MARKRKTSPRQRMLDAAKRQMMQSGEIHCAEDNRPVPETLQELYDELNLEHFRGELPDIPVIWNPGLRRALGKAYYTSAGKGKKRGTRKDCNPVKIEIQRGREWTPRFLRKVLIHEMCHCWAYKYHGEVGHGPQFWKKMRKLGYQKGHRFQNQQPGEGDVWCA